jgi:hypothetical protein
MHRDDKAAGPVGSEAQPIRRRGRRRRAGCIGVVPLVFDEARINVEGFLDR